jgi:spore germination protein KC
MKTAVVVSKDDAKPYIGSKAGMEDVPGISLNEMVRNARLTAEYFTSDMLQLSQQYFSPLKEPVLTTINFKKDKVMPSDGKAEQTVETVSIGGSAVFSRGKMLRMLTPEETRGFTWVFNRAENTLVTVPYPGGKNAFVSVETTQVKSKMTAKMENGRPAILIRTTGKGEVVEEDGTTDLPIEQFKNRIEELVAKQILQDIATSINLVQKELKVDSFCFAEVLHTQLNDEWKKSISPSWGDIYPNIPVTVSVKIDLVGSALNQEPARSPQ